jgi:hypothetical protein
MRGQLPPPERNQSSAGFAENSGFYGIDSQVLWPVAPSGDGQGKHRHAVVDSASLPVMQPNLGGVSMPRYSGDGHGKGVPFVQPTIAMTAEARTVRTPKAESMKLAMLVVFFLLWISTASTLLFLYMDRYLFAG